MTTVVYDKNTKEILAVLPEAEGESGFIRDDVEVNLYGDSEPCFYERDGKIYVKENAVFIRL